MPNETILVIDDESDIHKLLQYNLEKEGYRVLSAKTGEEGWETARLQKPDLILLDLMLPRMSGFEVCRMLKEERQTKHIPILMLTAKNSETDQVMGLELGAVDYISKPFSVKVLLSRLKNALKHKPLKLEEKPLLQYGDFSLDKDRVEFFVKQKPVKLTKTEFRIMGLLMERPGMVISRDKLVESVWGAGTIVSPMAINMHMKSLRQKLGKTGRNAVETVRGSGYRLREEPR